MKTIKLSTVIDRARAKGITFSDFYLQDELTITGVGTEKEPDSSDIINPKSMIVSLAISRKYAGLKTLIETHLTSDEFYEMYGRRMSVMNISTVVLS